MSMLLLNVFDRSRTRDTLASRGSRADTPYHIVTTFEAKESGAPGVRCVYFVVVTREVFLNSPNVKVSVTKLERPSVQCHIFSGSEFCEWFLLLASSIDSPVHLNIEYKMGPVD
jgi:hypothetical protein